MFCSPIQVWLGKDQPPFRLLQHLFHQDRDCLADVWPSFLDDDHGTIIQIPNPLPQLLAFLDDL